MIRDIRGQVALVTGASRGIGAAVAQTLAEAGCRVALTARGQADLDAVANKCKTAGVEAITLAADMNDAATPEALVSACTEQLGGLDILVNNAGVAHFGGAVTANIAAWEQMLDVNLRAVMRMTKAAVPSIRRGRRGAIVFVASISGKRGLADGAGYAASKHGVVGFAHSIFQDLKADGIKVSAICPGWVATDMATQFGVNPRHVIQPQDVADAVRFVVTFAAGGCPTEIILECQHPDYV